MLPFRDPNRLPEITGEPLDVAWIIDTGIKSQKPHYDFYEGNTGMIAEGARQAQDPDRLEWAKNHIMTTFNNFVRDGVVTSARGTDQVAMGVVVGHMMQNVIRSDTRSIVVQIAPKPESPHGLAFLPTALPFRVKFYMEGGDAGVEVLIERLRKHLIAFHKAEAEAARNEKKRNVTDTIASLLKWLPTHKHQGVKAMIPAIAAGEKIVINGPKLINDLGDHLGITGDGPINRMTNILHHAVEEEARRKAFAFPFRQFVLHFRSPMSLQDLDGPQVDYVLLVGDAHHDGSDMEIAGFHRADDYKSWSGPFVFSVKPGAPHPIFAKTRQLDQVYVETSQRLMICAILTLLACSLPNRSEPAPGRHPNQSPRIAGRPLIASKFKTLVILPPEPKTHREGVQHGDRRSPAYHVVKAHYRHYKSGKVVRIPSHHRGDAAGLIDKTYIH